MSVVLMTLEGPFQAWSLGAYQHRPTQLHPTKSGIIGLVAAACGYERNQLHGLDKLRYGVRVIKPGIPMTDLQTTGWDPERSKPGPLTRHGYLMDAEFLVGIEANQTGCRLIDHAMRHPVYAPYLGRRDCPPAGPIPVQITDLTLEQALEGPGDTYIEQADGVPVRDQPQDGRVFITRYEKHIDGQDDTDPFDLIKEATK